MKHSSVTSERMKDYIAEALLLLMEEKTFDKITVGEIVQKAGVNRSTYYRHFEKKEDVVFYFLDCLSADILKWDKEQNPDFKGHIINVYQHYYSHKEQILTIYKNGLSSLFLDVFKKNSSALEAENATLDMQYNIAFHIGGTFNHFQLWLSRDMVDTPEEMAKHTLAALPEYMIEHIGMTTKKKTVRYSEF